MTDAIKIEHFKGINNTPAYPLAIEGHAHNLAAGVGCTSVPFSWDQDAIVAKIFGVYVGVIVWSHAEYDKEVHVIHGYVKESHRRMGVYRAMWDALIIKAKETNAVRIVGTTNVSNEAMRKAAAALGRKEALVVTWFDIT